MAHAHLSQVWRNVHYGLSIVTIVLIEPNMAHLCRNGNCAITGTFLAITYVPFLASQHTCTIQGTLPSSPSDSIVTDLPAPSESNSSSKEENVFCTVTVYAMPSIIT